MKTLPKSLHTVTAWVNLSRYLMRVIGDSPETAALRAQEILGLQFMADTHELHAAVIKQLSKG
jgi:hypothetical protein